MRDELLKWITMFGYTLEDFTEEEIAQMEKELRDDAEGKTDRLDGILASLTYNIKTPRL